MKLLVTGHEGQVARALAKCHGGDVEIIRVGRPDLDLCDRASIDQVIRAHRPDAVVNAAAYTAVDKAESEPDVAFATNRNGAGWVAAAAASISVPIIQISTDYVFSGEKSSPYVESDVTEPSSVYGASKLAGEYAVAEANENSVILRTSWVYSPWGHNFAKTMLRLAADRKEIQVVDDQQGAPTYAPDIADGILTVARALLRYPDRSDLRGVFHMTSSGSTTWADFAEEIFARSAATGGPYASVRRVSTAEYPTPAKRPRNSRLDTSRFVSSFETHLPPWEDGVGRWIMNFG